MVKHVRHSYRGGVTLIEMMVVVGIFAVVSSVLLFNYSDFSTNVSIRNLSQDVALTIRKAQTYATSVQYLPNGVSTTAFPSYGISFAGGDMVASTLPYSKRFILFADIPSTSTGAVDSKYNDGGTCGSPSEGDECVDQYSISSADKIVEVCRDNAGVKECSSTGMLDIVFKRPSPDAIICYRPGGATDTCAPGTSSYARIRLQSAKGLERIISIWNTGQIAVE